VLTQDLLANIRLGLKCLPYNATFGTPLVYTSELIINISQGCKKCFMTNAQAEYTVLGVPLVLTQAVLANIRLGRKCLTMSSVPAHNTEDFSSSCVDFRVDSKC
jgi:hypothetical protein